MKKSSRNIGQKEDTTLEKQHEQGTNPMEMDLGEVPEDVFGGEEMHDTVPISSKMKKQTPKKKVGGERSQKDNDSDDDQARDLRDAKTKKSEIEKELAGKKRNMWREDKWTSVEDQMEDIAGKKDVLTVDRGEVLNKSEDRENPFVTSLVCNAESVNAQLLALITGDSRLQRKKNVQKEDKEKTNKPEEVDSTMKEAEPQEVVQGQATAKNLPVRDLTMPPPKDKERDEVWNPEETTRENSDSKDTKEQPTMLPDDGGLVHNWDSDMGQQSQNNEDDVRAEDGGLKDVTDQPLKKYKEVTKDMSKRSQMV